MLETDDDFDTLLRQSLALRPEPKSDVDYVAVVLAANPPRRSAVWSTIVAIVAFVGVLLVGVSRLLEIEGMASAISAESTATTTGNVNTLLPFGGLCLLAVIVWLTVRSACSAGDDGRLSLRL